MHAGCLRVAAGPIGAMSDTHVPQQRQGSCFSYKSPVSETIIRRPVLAATQLSLDTRRGRGFMSGPSHQFALLRVVPRYDRVRPPISQQSNPNAYTKFSVFNHEPQQARRPVPDRRRTTRTENDHFRGRCTGSFKTLPCNTDCRFFYVSDYVYERWWKSRGKMADKGHQIHFTGDACRRSVCLSYCASFVIYSTNCYKTAKTRNP
jgi:hypothetical protein